MIKRVFSALTALLILVTPAVFVYAENYNVMVTEDGGDYSFSQGGYLAIVEDNAKLFTDEQSELLLNQLKSVLPYGNAAVVTVGSHAYSSTDSFASETYSWMFGNNSGVLFVIDMYLRNIYIYCDGSIYKTISSRRAREITDNTYIFASKGNYYSCASESFTQITALLEGGRIFTPMKYVAALLISFGTAMMICIAIVIFQRRLPKLRKDKNGKELDGIETDLPMTVRTHLIKDKVTVRSSGSGGGGGGGGGGHGGGGGGHGF